MEYLSLEKLNAYVIAYELSNYVWDVVQEWDSFPRWTVGKQFVEASDSISANIAEGFGRYHKKDKIRYYRYSAGSTKESLDWTKKSINRGLLNEEQASFILGKLDALPQEINHLIKYTWDNLKY
ncbi:MAG: four helix bundle protein [Lewinellaceae bacterium]|nr:four helix bundle protein [Lewinellaceae bacterium]